MMTSGIRLNKTFVDNNNFLFRLFKRMLNTIVLALAVTAAFATPAWATVYNFTSIDIPGFGPSPTTSSFSLDTATATAIPNGSQFTNINLTYDSVVYPNSTITALFGTNLASSLFFFIDTGVTPFYTGTGATAVFNIGTFPVAEGFTDGEGTLSISAAVPETATWSMMLIGFGAIGFRIRRRRHQLARA